MGKPAARIGDMHVCPMVTPGLPPIPHVGGPVTGPGCPTVLIGGMPAAVLGDMCVCVGPPDTIVLGSAGVMIGGKPAARMGDQCAHGGAIILGCPTVLIGEASPGAAGAGGAGSVGAAGKTAGAAMKNQLKAAVLKNVLNQQALTEAAAAGDGLAPRTEKKDLKAQFTLIDEAEKPVKDVDYEIETTDGQKYKGKTDSSGKTANISGVTPADCRVTFFNT
ncbi:MAG TPA: PAAR domain-containing protein [Puia sp.]